MDKITYLAELAEGLARWVPERDRQDILRYYAEYFEEAGPGREGEVVAELGDPWALSCRLAVEGGFVTQEAANNWTPRQNKRKIWPLVTVAAVVCVAIVAVSVGSLASQIGRVVGRMVPGYSATTVVDGPDYAWSEPDWDGPYVEYVEGNAIGGFWNMEDGTLEAFESIDANISLGNIVVTEGEDYTLYIGQNGSLGGYSLAWEVRNGTLKIKDGSSGSGSMWSLDDLKQLFHVSNLSLDVVITVPGAAALDKVEVKTDLGNVYLSGVYAGEVEAKTDLGNVDCYDVRVEKKLGLKTDLGNVTLNMEELWDGVDIDLNTSTGNVEAMLGCAEWECAYELETGLGSVTVNGASWGDKAERKGGARCQLKAESGLGDVDVYFYE